MIVEIRQDTAVGRNSSGGKVGERDVRERDVQNVAYDAVTVKWTVHMVTCIL